MITVGEVDGVRDDEAGTKDSGCAKGTSLGQCKSGTKVSEDDL